MIQFRCSLLALAGAFLFTTTSLLAQETPVAFVGAEIIPIRGNPIPDGVLVVQRGKILAVGPRGTVVPAGTMIREVKGQVIMPGLVDTHSRGRARRYRTLIAGVP